MNWIANVYFWLLWFWGFADTDGKIQTPDDREKITFMLRRSKERMGVMWWVLSLGTIIGLWTVCLLVSWWYTPLIAFFIWLFVHVLYPYKPPDVTWGGNQTDPKIVIPPKEELFHDPLGGSLQ